MHLDAFGKYLLGMVPRTALVLRKSKHFLEKKDGQNERSKQKPGKRQDEPAGKAAAKSVPALIPSQRVADGGGYVWLHLSQWSLLIPHILPHVGLKVRQPEALLIESGVPATYVSDPASCKVFSGCASIRDAVVRWSANDFNRGLGLQKPPSRHLETLKIQIGRVNIQTYACKYDLNP